MPQQPQERSFRRDALKSDKLFLAGIVVFIALLTLRIPERLTVPTFFSEDGRTYFAFAFNHDWLEGLLAQRQGYYNFWANLVSVIAAKIVPLEQAPYAVLLGAYAVWALMAALILAPGSPFASPAAKIIALLLTALSPPFFGVVALSFSHFYFCVCAGLILVSKVETNRAKAWYSAVLFFCGISSPVAMFLLPLFVWTYVRSQSMDRAVQLAALSLAGIVQLIAFYHSGQYENHPNGRFSGIGQIDVFLFWMLNRSILHSFLGWRVLEAAGRFMQNARALRNGFYIPVVVGSAVILLGWIKLMFGTKGRNEAARLLTAAYMLTAILDFYTAYGQEDKIGLLYDAHRYFIPSAIFMAWVFLLQAVHAEYAMSKWVYSIIVGWMLLAGSYMWLFQARTPYSHSPTVFLVDWRSEVALWRKDPSHILKIAPEGWAVRLNPDGG